MANLSTQDRSRIWRGLMRRWSKDKTICQFTKQDLYNPLTDTGAVSDVDAWVDTHQGNVSPDTVGMNGALSVAMRSALSVEQKSDILIAVVSMRRGIEYLKSVFREVD